MNTYIYRGVDVCKGGQKFIRLLRMVIVLNDDDVEDNDNNGEGYIYLVCD